MKAVKYSVPLLISMLCTAFVNAQTVDEIIAKHLDAVGGKELLNSITSVHIEATAEVMGNEAPSTTTILNGKGFRNESEFNGQKVVRVYTDKGGWTINPFAGSGDPQAMPDQEYKSGEDEIYVEPFLNYADRGAKVQLLGQEKLGDVNAYKIDLTNKDGSSTIYYLDPSTFYVIQVSTTTNMMGQDMQVTTTLSDYKKSDDGFVSPQTLAVNIGDQFSMTSKIQKVDVNQPVDASIFEMKK